MFYPLLLGLLPILPAIVLARSGGYALDGDIGLPLVVRSTQAERAYISRSNWLAITRRIISEVPS